MIQHLNRLLRALLLALLTLTLMPIARAADAPNPDITAEVQPVVQKIQAKIQSGNGKAADLAENIKELDALMAKYKSKDAEGAANIGLLESQVYLQVLADDTKAIAVLEQVKKDFPGTKAAAGVDGMLEQLKAMAESDKIQRSLVPGSKFPDFSEKDISGNPLSVARFKGKVVLVDFWATWCGPCVHELPNVLDVYTKYHDKGFEVIGISLDADSDKLKAFLGTQKIPWPQYFDGKAWGNKLAGKYGIHSIPATYLVDGNGMIIARDVRGEELEQAVAKAVTKK